MIPTSGAMACEISSRAVAFEASAPQRMSAPLTLASIVPTPPGTGITWAICPIR
jgi:hypothetical protein